MRRVRTQQILTCRILKITLLKQSMEYKAEKVTPYGSDESKTQQVQEMFDSIAPAYDFMNRAMTFGIDKIWRRIAVGKLKGKPINSILDVATGTGDLAFLLSKKIKPRKINAIDLSEGMLSIAREKSAKKGINNITFETGNCLDLKYADNSFDAITVAYGVRNFEHLDKGYQEMYRVAAKGASVCIIELSTPTNPFALVLYKVYTRAIIPTIGRLVSHDRRAYTYLPESIAAVPQGKQMLQIMQKAGFKNCRHYPLTFGVCTIYIGEKL